jgi:hypothetical protein
MEKLQNETAMYTRLVYTWSRIQLAMIIMYNVSVSEIFPFQEYFQGPSLSTRSSDQSRYI